MKSKTPKKPQPLIVTQDNIVEVVANLKKKIAKANKPHFSIKLTIADKVYQGKGETALDALQALPKPEKIMYKGTLELSDGEMTKSMLFYPIRLKRLFYNKYFQSLQIKQLVAGMK